MKVTTTSGKSTYPVEKQKRPREARGTHRFANVTPEWFEVGQHLRGCEWALLSQMIRHMPTIIIDDAEFARRLGKDRLTILRARKRLERAGVYIVLKKGSGGWGKIPNTATLASVADPAVRARIIAYLTTRNNPSSSSDVFVTPRLHADEHARSLMNAGTSMDARTGQTSSDVSVNSSSDENVTHKEEGRKREGAALDSPATLRCAVEGAPPRGGAVTPLPLVPTGGDSEAVRIGLSDLELFSIFPALIDELEAEDDDAGDDFGVDDMYHEDVPTIPTALSSRMTLSEMLEGPAMNTTAGASQINGERRKDTQPDVNHWTTRQFARFYWAKVSEYRANVGEEVTRPDWGLLCGQIAGMLKRQPKVQLYRFILCLTEQFAEVAGQLHKFDVALNEKTLAHPIVSSIVNNLMRMSEDERSDIIGRYRAEAS